MRGQELMSDDDEFSRVAEIERAANGKASYLDMDAAFCARMRIAIEAGLENASIGVITTPGTQSPKYVPIEHLWPQVSPLVDMDF
jgi:hypothetical protein